MVAAKISNGLGNSYYRARFASIEAIAATAAEAAQLGTLLGNRFSKHFLESSNNNSSPLGQGRSVIQLRIDPSRGLQSIEDCHCIDQRTDASTQAPFCWLTFIPLHN